MARAEVSVEPRFRGGEGPPLVLLHAAFTSWRLWEPLLPLLTPHREVLAPTMMGHYGGPAYLPEHGPLAGAPVDALEAMLDDAGFERPDIVGNSLGGWAALELGRRGRARRVVGIGPMGMFDEREARRIRRTLWRQFRTARVIRRMAPLGMRSAFVRRRALAAAAVHGERVSVDLATHLAQATASCDAQGLAETLLQGAPTARPIEHPEEIDVPVLILRGERDPFATRAQMERYEQRLPQARLVELSGLAHCPQLDDPERVAREILDFTDPAQSR